MNTIVRSANADAIGYAAQLLQSGEIIGMPTETVYGLAANALSDMAVQKIFTAKGRPQDNPLISHIDSMDMLPMVVSAVPKACYQLAEAFWPGPLTIILPRAKTLSNAVCAGLDTAAVRMPSHPVALAIIHAAGVPLAAPSANLSGSPSPTTAQHVLDDMQGRIPLIIDGGTADVGVESTVVSLCGAKPLLLRPGRVTQEEISAVLDCEVLLADAVLHKMSETAAAPSPGMKYKHYAPKANVILIKGSLAAYNNYVNERAGDGVYRLCFTGEENTTNVPCVTYGSEENAQEQANRIFAALRELDALHAVTVYARCPKAQGVALAVYNRMLRAAAFRVVELSV
ncbi:MAG: threonylcarbamoyl-AMP synthase [Oscillospiraceae bacterium]|nr:threonylcarbamoyl-AMP synthase [Oscillospiraceae bacterium]